MIYTIGSFNVREFNFTSTDEIKRNFDRLAAIIKGEGFDVIALQEVLSEFPVKNLVRHLGEMYWEYRFEQTKVTVSSKAQNEGYAFLWKKRRLHLVEGESALETQNNFQIKPDGSGKYYHYGSLVRPPLVIRLTPQGLPGGSNFELRLINTHIAFSSPVNCADCDKNDERIRKMELRVLAEEVFNRTATKRYGNNLPAYTVLLGDYNLCLAGGGSPVMDEYIAITDSRSLRTVQKLRTSLKKPKEPSAAGAAAALDAEHDAEAVEENTTDFYSRNYDHFSYEASLDGKMTLIPSRVDALEKYYGNNLQEYRKEISDHVPIKLVMNFRTR